MESAAILKISESHPELLFPNSEEEAKKLFRKLMKEWHPDVNKSPEAQRITTHIQRLYDLVEPKIKDGTWASPNTIVLKGVDGKLRTIKYRIKRKFELGEMFYGDRVICYIVGSDAKDLFGRGLETIKNAFTYKDDKIKEEIERYLPVVLDNFEITDGSNVLILAKTPDVFLIQDVIDSIGPLDPKHVSWIMSCFHNLSCYLRTIGLTHNAISTTTCFISPKFHSGLLLGGWWYSQFSGKNIVALPGHSVINCPSDIMKNKIADPRLDQTLIRQMGLDCLGDSTGMNLLHDGKTPRPLLDFLRSTSDGNAFKDYKQWEKSRTESFGKRRFVEMNIQASDIYKD